MHQSIVRSGNHFIRFNSPDSHPRYKDKWLLIDGPWFDYLEKKRVPEIMLRPYYRMSGEPIADESPPQEYETLEDMLLWQRLKVVHHKVMRGILLKATCFTAWQCNEGVLPAWIKNEHWDENLEELFSLTTYEVQEW